MTKKLTQWQKTSAVNLHFLEYSLLHSHTRTPLIETPLIVINKAKRPDKVIEGLIGLFGHFPFQVARISLTCVCVWWIGSVCRSLF